MVWKVGSIGLQRANPQQGGWLKPRGGFKPLESTTMLGKFEKFNYLLSGWFERIGVAGLLMMMFTTFFDVLGCKLFLLPILGALDMVMLAQTVAIAFAAPMVLILGRHIQVEFFVTRLPKHIQVVVDAFILLLQLTLFILIVWRLSTYGYSLQRSGEISPTASIPLYPFAYGIGLASIPVCLVLLQKFLTLLTREIEK